MSEGSAGILPASAGIPAGVSNEAAGLEARQGDQDGRATGYKDALRLSMEALARDPAVCFVGYGVKIGGRAAGTLKNVPEEQLIETPVAENLMAGMAIGLALKGRKPVVFIERFDFILNALDAIVNHLDKAARISDGEFTPAVIFRVVVGNRQKPLFTGATHTQDFSAAINRMVDFPVIQLRHMDSPATQIEKIYYYASCRAWKRDKGLSSMIVEYKDLY